MVSRAHLETSDNGAERSFGARGSAIFEVSGLARENVVNYEGEGGGGEKSRKTQGFSWVHV